MKSLKNKIYEVKNHINLLQLNNELPFEDNYSIDWNNLKMTESNLGCVLIESQLSAEFNIGSNAACASASEQAELLSSIMAYLGFKLTEKAKDIASENLSSGDWFFDCDAEEEFAYNFITNFKKEDSLNFQAWKPWAVGGC